MVRVRVAETACEYGLQKAQRCFRSAGLLTLNGSTDQDINRYAASLDRLGPGRRRQLLQNQRPQRVTVHDRRGRSAAATSFVFVAGPARTCIVALRRGQWPRPKIVTRQGYGVPECTTHQVRQRTGLLGRFKEVFLLPEVVRYLLFKPV